MNERNENYSWSTGQTGPVISVTEPGQYYVSVYQTATECLARDTVEVKRPDFVLDFDYQSALMTSYFNAKVTTPCSGEMPSEWLWDFGDGKTSSSPYPSHRYTRPGNYPVTLTVVSAGTTRTIRRTISTPLNFRNITRPLPFQPDSSLRELIRSRNTFSGLVVHYTVVTEQVVLEVPGSCDYQLMTVAGQIMGRGRLTQGTNIIPAGGLRSGVFFLLLLNREERELIRLFKR